MTARLASSHCKTFSEFGGLTITSDFVSFARFLRLFLCRMMLGADDFSTFPGFYGQLLDCRQATSNHRKSWGYASFSRYNCSRTLPVLEKEAVQSRSSI